MYFGLIVANSVFIGITVIAYLAYYFGYMHTYTQKQMSDMHRTTLTPASFTFMVMSILIAVALIAWNVLSYYFFLPSVFAVHVLLIVACIVTIGWLYTYCRGMMLWSTVMRIVTLGLVAAIYVRLGVFYSPFMTKLQAFGEFMPFSVLVAWILFVNFVNFFNATLSKGDKISQSRAAFLVCVVLLIPAGLLLWITADVFFCGALVFILFGVGSAQYMTHESLFMHNILPTTTQYVLNPTTGQMQAVPHGSEQGLPTIQQQQMTQPPSVHQDPVVGKTAYLCAILIAVGIVVRLVVAFF